MHIVFSTKERARVIGEKLQPKLWAYMAGIAKNHGMHAVAIGGIEDHLRSDRSRTDLRSFESRTGVESQFIAMDK